MLIDQHFAQERSRIDSNQFRFGLCLLTIIFLSNQKGAKV